MRRRRARRAVTGSAPLDRRLGADTLERLINVGERLRTSLWFVPTIMLVLAVAAVRLFAWLDSLLRLDASDDPPLLYRGGAVEATGLLEALVTSMITMVSLVFSITMVVLTLAASQFGPRLIRSFMADRGTQLFLGAFVAAITYGLLVLVELRPDEAVPRLSVTAAIAAALGTVFLLLFFMHRISRSIVAETIIQRVGAELDDTIERLLPIDDGGSPAAARRQEDRLPDDLASKARAVALCRTGYVQAVEYDRLVQLAARHDLLLMLTFRAGDHVVADGCRIFAYPGERCPPDLDAAIDRLLLIGRNRTPTQDIEFSIRHLVEIALRALSPSLNDAYTAMAVIDRLGASLAALMGRALPSERHRDGGGRLRVVGQPPTYRGIFAAAFHQIRQAGCAHPAVVIRLLNTIERIAEHIRLEEQRRVLVEHLRIVAEDGIRCAGQEADAADIRTALAAAERPLWRPAAASPQDKAIAEWFSSPVAPRL